MMNFTDMIAKHNENRIFNIFGFLMLAFAGTPAGYAIGRVYHVASVAFGVA